MASLRMEPNQLLPQTFRFSKRLVFIVIWLFSILIIAVGVTMASYYSGQFLPSYNARVTEFFTCSGPPQTPTISVQPINSFATTSQAIYACGLLEGTTFRRFAFYWYRDGASIYNTLDARIEPGFFYSLLPNTINSSGYSPGHYQVEIYRGRVKVASTEFTIR